MTSNLIEYREAYFREKLARKKAERILEDKTRELSIAVQELRAANESILRQQRQLLKTEKLAALGTLSAGVAHEINNPLAFIMSNLNSLRKYYDNFFEIINVACEKQSTHKNMESQRKQIEKIIDKLPRKDIDYVMNDSVLIFDEVQEGLVRVKDIVANLNRFSRTKSADREHGDVNDAVRMALKILEGELKYRCELSVDLQSLKPIYCNLNEVSQVFVNIIMNAIQSLGNEGAITINTRQRESHIEVAIRDNGEGIKKEDLEKIFVPFFTGKPLGVGTGLGLSVSYGIIEELGGEIQVESEYGVGTEFTVCIPVEQRSRERDNKI